MNDAPSRREYRNDGVASPAIPGRPGVVRLVARGLVVAVVAIAYLVPSALCGLIIAAARGRQAGCEFRYRRMRRLLERLGPTYVKFGQIASGRRDVLAPALCAELSVLHDRVAPMSRGQARRALTAAYGRDLDVMFAQVDPEPVASGSIACIYRATLGNGAEVALKLRRPGIGSRMVTDLALLERATRLAERFPKCQGMPIGDLTAYVCAAILGQLDFQREGQNLVHIRDHLAAVEGVRVPALVTEASRESCLVMEFMEGLDVANVALHPSEVRDRLALTALEATTRLMFLDGFVHCDLHAGNLYVTRQGKIVILDAGFSVRLPDEIRALIGEFFLRLAQGDGRRCGEIILASAAEIAPQADAERFVDAVAAVVAATAGPEVSDFTMMSFGNDLFDLQRDFGLYAKSDFAFPLMALATIEATVRMISPTVDFQAIGRFDGAARTRLLSDRSGTEVEGWEDQP